MRGDSFQLASQQCALLAPWFFRRKQNFKFDITIKVGDIRYFCHNFFMKAHQVLNHGWRKCVSRKRKYYFYYIDYWVSNGIRNHQRKKKFKAHKKVLMQAHADEFMYFSWLVSFRMRENFSEKLKLKSLTWKNNFKHVHKLYNTRNLRVEKRTHLFFKALNVFESALNIITANG